MRNPRLSPAFERPVIGLGDDSAMAGQDLRINLASKRSNIALAPAQCGRVRQTRFNLTSKRLVIGLGVGSAWAVRNLRLSPAFALHRGDMALEG